MQRIPALGQTVRVVVVAVVCGSGWRRGDGTEREKED